MEKYTTKELLEKDVELKTEKDKVIISSEIYALIESINSLKAAIAGIRFH